ncbi:unnamed protein product [Adineta ricciae]|nr:unnamed protein product [Adineta ricciae]
MLNCSLLAVFVLVVLVIEAKPVRESSSASNDKQAIKPNQQLYEIYKFMRADPRLADFSNKELIVFIHQNLLDDIGDAPRTEQVTDDLRTTSVTTTDSNIDDTISPTNGPFGGTTADTLSMLTLVTDSSSSHATTTIQETGTSTTTTTTDTTSSVKPTYNAVAIWNTVAGGNSTLASEGTGSGCYQPGHGPLQLFDGDTSTSYRAYGSLSPKNKAGLNTGFYLTSSLGAFKISAVRFATASDHMYSPRTITIEGSNETTATILQVGTAWMLLYNGATGFSDDQGENTLGSYVTFNKTNMFFAYRFLVTSKRGTSDSVEYSEVEFQ